jgi:hypothetical protein
MGLIYSSCSMRLQLQGIDVGADFGADVAVWGQFSGM